MSRLDACSLSVLKVQSSRRNFLPLSLKKRRKERMKPTSVAQWRTGGTTRRKDIKPPDGGASLQARSYIYALLPTRRLLSPHRLEIDSVRIR